MSIILIDMNKKILLITFFFLSVFIYSQEMKLFAPFPSRILVATSGTNVLISWKDAKDISNGGYEIFRSETVITADNLYLAEKVGDSMSSIENYYDTPPIGINFFYAVFAKDSEQTYKICIPYRNVTTSPVRIDESAIEETKSAHISNITALLYDSDVAINFTSSLEDRGIIIFRSTYPIDSYSRLLEAVNIAEIEGSDIKYTDKPMAGIPFYYAAVDSGLYRSGSENLLYDGNHTIENVQVKFSHEIKSEAEYIKATMPLPLLKVNNSLESGILFPEPATPEKTGSISSENIKSISRLIGYSELPVYETMDIDVLGYNTKVNHIVNEYFLNRNWDDTVTQLEKYTSFSYDKETRIQSHFYRGQSYYFLDQYNKALLEFIMIEEELYVETEPWFKAIYRKIKN